MGTDPPARFVTTSRGIVVLGMHRSGTSATARLLGELGCDFGGELLSGRDDNPDGYFEHKDVVETHNDFLRAMGREWDDPRPWRDEFTSAAADEARARLGSIFERDFASRQLWVLKDPRLCRLLPLWDDLLDDADVRFAIVHRHPLAVARSLDRRDAMHSSRALMIWLRHVLEAERGTRRRRRTYFRFEELIADPGKVLPGVLQRLGLGELATGSSQAADRALEPSQLHHRADDEDREQLRTEYPWVDRCHRALCELDGAESGTESTEADALRRELSTADRLYQDGVVAPLVEALADSNLDRNSLRMGAAEREAYVASLLEELQTQTAYTHSLETRLEESEAATAEYVASLRESLEAKDRYAAKLLARMEQLERR